MNSALEEILDETYSIQRLLCLDDDKSREHMQVVVREMEYFPTAIIWPETFKYISDYSYLYMVADKARCITSVVYDEIKLGHIHDDLETSLRTHVNIIKSGTVRRSFVWITSVTRNCRWFLSLEDASKYLDWVNSSG